MSINDDIIKDLMKISQSDKIKIWKYNNPERVKQHSRDLYNRRKNDPEYITYKREVNRRVLLRKKLAKETEILLQN